MVAGSGKVPEHLPIPSTAPKPAVPKVKAEKPAPPIANDNVTLSPVAVRAQALSAAVNQTPEVRPEVVAAAKEAASRPPAPAAKVAEKLLLGD